MTLMLLLIESRYKQLGEYDPAIQILLEHPQTDVSSGDTHKTSSC